MHGMKPELIVALDVPRADAVEPIIAMLPDAIRWYKVGLELFTAAGPAVIDLLHRQGRHIFLDLKLHDIPNTVAQAVHSAALHHVDLLTVHAVGGRHMLAAAVQAASELGVNAPKLIAVTTLTSLSEDDLREVGIERAIGDQAIALGRMALECGVDGLVCSVHEVERLRAEFGPEPILVTPGIRLADDQMGDQKRVATPEEAVRLGSSYLVVGRSLLNAMDPRATAEEILKHL